MKLFAGKQVVNALVERVVLGDEMLALSSDTLSGRGIGEIIRAAVEAMLEILVPRAVVAVT